MSPWLWVGVAGLVVVVLLLHNLSLQRRLRRRVRDDREVSARVEERVGEATKWYHDAQRFRMIFNHASNVIALLASDGTVLEANGMLLRLAGRSDDQVVGKRLWDTPTYNLAGLPERLDEAVASRLRAGLEGELRTWEERSVRMVFSLTPVLDDRGCVEFVIVEGAARGQSAATGDDRRG